MPQLRRFRHRLPRVANLLAALSLGFSNLAGAIAIPAGFDSEPAGKEIHGALQSSIGLTSTASSPSFTERSSSGAAESNYQPPTFMQPAPRKADRRNPIGSGPTTPLSDPRYATDTENLPSGGVTVIISGPEGPHPWVNFEDFITDCPTGAQFLEVYGLCTASFVIFNDSNFRLSGPTGFDLSLQPIVDPENTPVYYSTQTPLCKVGTFNAVVPCIISEVGGAQAFKAQESEFSIAPWERIPMTKTIFWSLDPSIWWIPGESTQSSCPGKQGNADGRECAWTQGARAQGVAADPISTRTGAFDYSVKDLSVSTAAGELSFQRSYSSAALAAGPLGPGWTHNQDVRLIFPGDLEGELGVVWFKAHSSNRYAFIDNEDGTYSAAPGVGGTLTKDSGTPNSYTITSDQGQVYRFDEGGKLEIWFDADGKFIAYGYDAQGRLTQVGGPNGARYLSFAYDAQDRIITVTDSSGRAASFGYDSAGDLVTATDVLGGEWTYDYDAGSGSDHRLRRVVDPRGTTEVRVEYDGEGRAVRQFNGKDELQAELTYNGDGTTNVTDGRGNSVTHRYDALNALVQETDPAGGTTSKSYGPGFELTSVTGPAGQTTQMTWSEDGVDLLRVVDAAGNQTDFSYDSSNNLIEIVDSRSFITSFTYVGRLLTSSTDPLGNTTTYAYTPEGYLISVTDARGQSTLFTYDGLGQPLVMTDARGNSWSYTYDDLGRLVDVTDPMSRVTHSEYNAAGRIVRLTLNYDTSKSQNQGNEFNVVTEYSYDAVGNLVTITDTYGRQSQFDYDDADRLIGLVDAAGNRTTNSYDVIGNLTSTTDPLGNTSFFEYDELNRVIRVVDPLGNTFVSNYNPDDTTASTTDALGRTTSYAYDTLKRIAAVTDPLGLSTRFTYDPSGNLTTITDARGNTTGFEYDALDRLIRQTDPLAGVSRNFYDAVGNRLQNIDARGNATTFGYDQVNRLISITDPLGNEAVFAYDSLSNLLGVTDALGRTTSQTYDRLNRRNLIMDPLGQITLYGYDALGNRTSVVDPLGVEARYEYDDLGRLAAVVENYVSGGPDNSQTNVRSQYTYDAVGNLISVRDALGSVSAYTYDALDRLNGAADPLGNTTNFSYDAVGNRTGRTDALGQTTALAYDEADRLTSIDYPDPDQDVGFGYDEVGNLEEMVDGFGTTNWIYDALDRIAGVTDPFGSTVGYGYDAGGNRTSQSFDGKASTFAYDAANRLTRVTDWSSQATDYEYDAANRLTEVAFPNGLTSSRQYDEGGRLQALTHATPSLTLATYGYAYDAGGNRTVAAEIVPKPSEVYPSTYFLDDAENGAWPWTAQGDWDLVEGEASSPSRAWSLNSGGEPQSNSDMSLELIVPLVIPGRSANPELTYFENADIASDTAASVEVSTDAGRSWTILRRPGSSVGAGQRSPGEWIKQRQSLEEYRGEVIRLRFRAVQGSSAFSDNWLIDDVQVGESEFTYSLYFPLVMRSANGSSAETAQQARLPVSSSTAEAELNVIQFDYDDLGRLAFADYSTGKTFRYDYDAVGNRLKFETEASSSTYTYDAAHRLTAFDGVTYAWDANGNLLSDGVTSYAYDHANRLTEAGDGTDAYAFGYNGLGDRLQVTTNGSPANFTLDLNGRLTQVLSDGSTDYLYGLGRVAKNGSAGWAYQLPDATSSPRQWVGDGGSIALTQSYAPFGDLQASAGSLSSSIGFSGEWADPTGLVFLRARYYQPGDGRFITRDPFPGLLALPPTLNPYVYALNNPQRYSDPSGQLPFLALIGVAALAGGGIGAIADYASQVSHNMKNCGMSFWDATYYQNIDAKRLGLAFAEGFVLGGFGGLTGGLVQWAGLTSLGAFAAAGVLDVEAGMIWDMGLRGYTPSEAFLTNLVSFGIGGAIGAIGRSAASVIDPGLEIITRSALPAPGRFNPDAGEIIRFRTVRDIVAYRVWGGKSEQVGKWLTPYRPPDRVFARQVLALPPENLAQYVSEVTIPAGTLVQFSLVAQNFGQQGGGIQILLLDRIPKSAFGRGLPLALALLSD